MAVRLKEFRRLTRVVQMEPQAAQRVRGFQRIGTQCDLTAEL